MSEELRGALKSKLNGKHTIIATNTCAVVVMRSGAGIISSTKCELEGIDRKTGKLMNVSDMFHPGKDVDRLYIPREVGGRGR